MSISEGLKKGDRVECSVYLVDDNIDTNTNSYLIIYDPNAILTYTRYSLWLYQNPDFFKRLEVDTPETLKYRRQNYYMDRNRKTIDKIAGKLSYKYNYKKWIIKKPILLSFVFLWIRIKTTLSNLRGYLSAKDLTILGIIISVPLAVLGIFVTIIVAIIFR